MHQDGLKADLLPGGSCKGYSAQLSDASTALPPLNHILHAHKGAFVPEHMQECMRGLTRLHVRVSKRLCVCTAPRVCVRAYAR
eukprot:299082-Pleurochrysis_carterae.AAC.2